LLGREVLSDRKKLTKNQAELLKLVWKGNPEGEGGVDLDQLLDRVSWKPTKQAFHFSIRALSKRGFLKKEEALVLRRGRLRVVFNLTPEGSLFFDPRGPIQPVDNSKNGLKNQGNQSHISSVDIDFLEEDEFFAKSLI
jgi:hypothetical protein